MPDRGWFVNGELNKWRAGLLFVFGIFTVAVVVFVLAVRNETINDRARELAQRDARIAELVQENSTSRVFLCAQRRNLQQVYREEIRAYVAGQRIDLAAVAVQLGVPVRLLEEGRRRDLRQIHRDRRTLQEGRVLGCPPKEEP